MYCMALSGAIDGRRRRPLSLLLWRAVLREPGVTKSSFAAALVAGFVFHGLVLLNLPIDKSDWVAG